MKFKTDSEQDAYLQKLPVSILKDLEQGLEYRTVKNEVSDLANEDDVLFLSLNDLKSVVDKTLIEEKIKLTGLSKVEIEEIEKRKEKASLENIIKYCEGLQINYQQFLPELFA